MKKFVSNIVKLLIKKKMTISFAESCTGGLLASVITAKSGSSKTFKFGVVTYSNEAKIKFLKVPKTTIKKYGAVSSETCKSMVNNLNRISKTNIAMSVTGIAGPNGGTKKKPVGLVYIGIKKGKKIIVKKNLFKMKNRNLIQKSTVKVALRMIDSLISNNKL